MYREKLVARAAREFVVIADASKEVPKLGIGCPVPVEVLSDRLDEISDALRDLGADPKLRREGEATYITDNGKPILDAFFDGVEDPKKLEETIDSIPGVFGNGLFPGITRRVLIADPSGVREWFPSSSPEAESADR